ncbi:MAG: hypothetical protein ACI8S6_002538 [Myxococcota bacterium]|jgi:hypothetical protein
MKNRTEGALLVGGLAALLPALGCAWAAVVNPWFLDAPLSFIVLALLPLAVVGAGLGALLGRGAGRLSVAPGIAAVVLVLASALRPLPGPVDSKLLIFGIDGASWAVMEPLTLPSIDRLSSEGSRAVLESREPMFSPLLWTTMASGKVPDEHGIHGFHTQADHCRAARLWDIAGAEGMSFGIYKWLVTWPPYTPPAGGFIVPAWLAAQPDTEPADLSFIKELELSRRLKRRKVASVRSGPALALAGIQRGLRWSTLRTAATWSLRERVSRPGEAERAWKLNLLRVQMDRDVFIYALHRHQPQLATFTTYATDALGHSHWGLDTQCAPEDCPPWASAVSDAYRQADAVLGEILENLSPETAVMVVSDHGFRSASEADAGRYFAPLTERLRARITAEVGSVDISRLGHKLTIGLLEADPVAQRASLEAWLATLVQGSTGEPVYRWESLPDTERAIGLTLRDEMIDDEQLENDTVGGEPLSDYVKRTEGYSGEHDKDGIILVRAPGVAAGGQAPPVALLDVAPTALTLLGLPAAEDMPGAVWLLPERPRVPSHDSALPTFSGEHGDGDVNEDMLRALGYIE